jgi:hypothetical protein
LRVSLDDEVYERLLEHVELSKKVLGDIVAVYLDILERARLRMCLRMGMGLENG